MAAVVQSQASLTHAWKLSGAQALALMRQATPLQAGRGALIARRGQRLPGVFLLQSGTVKLSLHAAEGDERILRVVMPGDTFGEPTALLGKPCLYDAFALSEARLVIIPTPAVFELIDRDCRFARRLVLALAARSFGILEEFGAATTQRGVQRLAGYLHSLAAASRDRRTILLPVSKTVVAALLGMKKETLSRLFHQLSDEGVIAVERREITILNAEGLATLASQPAPP
jgi:CRP/FNR family transcriptional regulator, dissimilatory nitrate respiration regulator